MSNAPKALRPCPFANAAMTVPSRRWATRLDLTSQLAKAETYIRACPLSEFSVERAAQVAGLSVHHFIRLFRSVYSQTPYQFFAERRMQEAKALLGRKRFTILEVAFMVGFVDASAFARSFRKAAGTTPSGYRNAILATSAQRRWNSRATILLGLPSRAQERTLS